MAQHKTTLQQSTPGAGARKAALRLSGVSVADRRWILQQLEPAQRLDIGKALQELKQITGNRRLDFGMFLDVPAQTESAAGISPGAQSVNRLPYAPLAALLDELPDHHAAAVLNSGQWQGTERYLRDAAGNRRKVLAELKPVLTPHAGDALLLELAAMAAGGET